VRHFIAVTKKLTPDATFSEFASHRIARRKNIEIFPKCKISPKACEIQPVTYVETTKPICHDDPFATKTFAHVIFG
jgi:hypothetical protein